MRISTSMTYELGSSAVSTQQSELYKLQGQISSGKRITNPSDDPIAAARTVDINQSKSVSEQLSVNADYATSALQAQESALSDVSTLLSDMRVLGVHAGAPSLTVADRTALAQQLRSQYAQLLSLANTSDGGKYLFSGYQGDTQPFSETSPGVVAYNGDEGYREMQVTPSRQVPVSTSGKEVFQRILNGNGTFAVKAATNTGSGVATPGVLLDSTKWANAANNKDFTVKFDVSAASPPVTTYDIVDNVSGNSMLTGVAAAAGPYLRTYTDGATISLKTVAPPDTTATPFDFGAELAVSGIPSTGDTFTVKASTQGNDVFKTVYGLINALETTSGASLANSVQTFLANLDQVDQSVMKAVTAVGATLQEVDSHKSVNQDLILQYKTYISNLQDLDYASALTDLSLRQNVLTASQKSFVTVQGLSLFNYMP